MKIEISLSGLIKLPPNLVSHVQNLVRIKLLSYALYSTESSEYSEVHALIERLMKEYNIEPIDFMAAMQHTETNVDVSGLPKSYYKFMSLQDGIIIGLDNVNSKSAAYFSKPNKLFVCTAGLRKYLFSKFTVFYRDLKSYFDELDATVLHELTHYVQHNFLHEANKGMKSRYDSRRPDFDVDDYYSSQIEFDPQIKTEVAHLLEFCKRHYGTFRIEDSQINALVSYYVGAKSEAETSKLVTPSVLVSDFFKSLKKVKPMAYKKAIRLFSTEFISQYNKRFPK